MRVDRLAVCLFLVLGSSGAFGCAKGASLEKIPEAEVDANHKITAEKFGNRVMHAWASDSYPTVTEAEATPAFSKGHNEIAKQKEADKVIEQMFGNFKSMTFYEALRTKPAKYETYRFKGTVEKGTAEVRVSLDLNGKLAGHHVLVWKNET